MTIEGQPTMPSVSASNSNKQPFFKMTAEQAREDYKQKLITAEAYILYILKAHRSAGWKWTFSVKEFCKQWDIKERTFYYALSKLKTKKLVNWQAEGRVTLWWGADIGKGDFSDLGNPPDSVTASAPQPVAEAVQDVAGNMNQIAVDEQFVADNLHCIAQKQPESIATQEVENPIYIQRETDSTESGTLPLTPSQESAAAPLGGASPEEEKLLEDWEFFEYFDQIMYGVCPPIWVLNQAYQKNRFYIQVKACVQRSDFNLEIEGDRVINKKASG